MNLFYISEEVTQEQGVDDGELVVLVVGGELDYQSSPSLSKRIVSHIDQGSRRFLLDISDVTFIDSTAIGVLVGAVAKLRNLGGGSLAVVCAGENEKVLKIFDIAGVESLITLHSSCADARSVLALTD
jgi:anti-sigma B factor antagonist